MLRFVCYSELNQLTSCADELFEYSAKKSIFLAKEWFENLVATSIEDDEETVFACVRDATKIVSVLPLLRNAQGDWGIIKNLYSSICSALVCAENKHAVLQCLAKGLTELGIISLQFNAVAESDSNMSLLEQALNDNGYQSQRFHHFYNWVYRTELKNYQIYLAERPSKLRNTIIRKQRKLEREHNYSIQLYIDKDINTGLADYHNVYQKSWKAKELYLSFIEGLAGSLARKGWLRLAVLYIDSQPAAAQFWFVAYAKASIFKLVYNEQWKHYSPGTILTAYLMRHVIDVDKVSSVDFLTGNDAYKSDWMTERRERYRVNFYKNYKPHTSKFGYVAKLKSLLKW